MRVDWKRLRIVLKKAFPAYGSLSVLLLAYGIYGLTETGKTVGVFVALLWAVLMSLFIIIVVYIMGWDDDE